MNRNPTKTDQVADLSPFRAWVEDYRKLKLKDKSEFIKLFLTQEFGIQKKRYGKDVFLQWTRKNGTAEPPLEVAKWCSQELVRIHCEIKALQAGF